MTGTPLRIRNRDARRLWLEAQGLSATPTGPLDLAATIRKLGFVQIDSIRVVARAHDHILWSRNQNYREPMLGKLLKDQRAVFEHFTHDASVIPIEFYPNWRRQFRRMEARVRSWDWHAGYHSPEGRAAIRERIRAEGPLSSHAFDTRVEGKREMWRRPPHKLSLDYMWYAGELSTSHRDGFTKFYDLTERVIPHTHLKANEPPVSAQIDWLCREALARLAFGTEGEIQRFWGAADLAEVKAWVAAQTDLVPVEIESAEGEWSRAFAPAGIETRIASAERPSSRLRILNPFDPVVRDRNRLKRLFGFDYRIEIFVPAARRIWGYYAYPLLEGDQMIGRLTAKADRNAGRLTAERLWIEPGIGWTPARAAKLEAELVRLARLADVSEVKGVTRANMDIPGR